MKDGKGRCCLSVSEFIGPGRNDAHAGHGASGATRFHHDSVAVFIPPSWMHWPHTKTENEYGHFDVSHNFVCLHINNG